LDDVKVMIGSGQIDEPIREDTGPTPLAKTPWRPCHLPSNGLEV